MRFYRLHVQQKSRCVELERSFSQNMCSASGAEVKICTIAVECESKEKRGGKGDRLR